MAGAGAAIELDLGCAATGGGVGFLLLHVAEIKPSNGVAGEKISFA